jgi:hypothetical protein
VLVVIRSRPQSEEARATLERVSHAYLPFEYARAVSDRYRHELRFSGPEDPAALIDAAEKAGFSFESGSTEPDEGIAEVTVQRDEARGRLQALRTRLADRRGEPSD